jgi:hypothetical protein
MRFLIYEELHPAMTAVAMWARGEDGERLI